MKRFKVHFFCGLVFCLLLTIGRATFTSEEKSYYQRFKDSLSAQYNQAKSYIIRGAVLPAIKRMLRSQEKAIINNPYKDTVAHVRIDNNNTLHEQERAYVQQRKPRVKKALEKMLGRSLADNDVPTIAMIGSGGGYRAMLGTTGFLVGADKIGLLDATTYISALSGSTWALGTWIATGLPIQDFRIYLVGTVIKNIHKVQAFEAKEIVDALATKLSCDQPMTLVDLYGGLLANRLLEGFGKDRQLVYLSHQADRIKDGSWPYPIYTAVDGSEKVARDACWYEFTPHEVGSARFKAYVPTWAYGRQFNFGESIDTAPEQSLGFFFGTFGSAFAVHFEKAWQEISADFSHAILKPIIEKYVIEPIAGKRIFWSEVFNYMRNMSNIPNTYERMSERSTLKVVDAGLECNLPYPPISGERPERAADVMIFLDSSAGKIPVEFKKVEAYARKYGLKFPKIDFTDLDKHTVSIFKDDEDVSVPVVIYMPRISDAELWEANKLVEEYETYNNSISYFDMEAVTNLGGFTTTTNFEYTESQSQQVLDQMEFNMVVNKNKIIEVLNWVIDRKKGG